MENLIRSILGKCHIKRTDFKKMPLKIYNEKGDARFMRNVFCVIMSKYRVYQGIALYRSLELNYPDFTMFILCVDDDAYQVCNSLDLDKAILIKDEELNDERLKNIKKNRRLNEYCWTLKPFFISHVLSNYDFIENAVSLDADIFFFHDPSPIFKRQGDFNILLSEHNYLEKDMGVSDICGKYNSGFIVFRKCNTSLELLNWWKEKCIEWCFDAVDKGRFGDQKYLDYMEDLFEGIKSITVPGVNIAPWNEDRYRFSESNNEVFINEYKLIFYHFCGLRLVDSSTFALVIGNQLINNCVHKPYVHMLQQIINDIEKLVPGFDGFSIEDHFKNTARMYKINI